MVILQAGHVNISSNCSADMRSGTGAPAEAQWTLGMAQNVYNALHSLGIASRIVDANFNCAPDVGDQYDAVIAIHYQANLPTPSGFYVGTMNPSEDGNPNASAHLQAELTAHYSMETGLHLQAGWNNPNITEYYLWKFINGATPVALIECGVGAPGAPDHQFLWNEPTYSKVVRGIANGVAAYLGRSGTPLPQPAPLPEPVPPPPPRPAPSPQPPPDNATLEGEIQALRVRLDLAGHTLEGV